MLLLNFFCIKFVKKSRDLFFKHNFFFCISLQAENLGLMKIVDIPVIKLFNFEILAMNQNSFLTYFVFKYRSLLNLKLFFSSLTFILTGYLFVTSIYFFQKFICLFKTFLDFFFFEKQAFFDFLVFNNYFSLIKNSSLSFLVNLWAFFYYFDLFIKTLISLFSIISSLDYSIN